MDKCARKGCSMPADTVNRTDSYCSVQCRNIVDHRREVFEEAAEEYAELIHQIKAFADAAAIRGQSGHGLHCLCGPRLETLGQTVAAIEARAKGE